MIILKKIQLNNFLSHTKTEIEFKPEQKLLIDGKSGAGKSAIVEALVWGLYGKGRSDNRALIKKGTKKAEVSISLQDDQTKEEFIIERNITHNNKHTVQVLSKQGKGEPTLVKVSGTRELQEYIEKKILHSSYLLFINSIVYPQDNIENFVKQTATRRKDIILEIINASAYDEYLKKTKEELTKLENAKSILKARQSDKENAIKSDKETAQRLSKYEVEDAKLKQTTVEIENKYKELVETYNIISEQKIIIINAEAKLVNIQTNIGDIQFSLDENNKRVHELSSIDTKQLESQVTKLKDNRETLKTLEHDNAKFLEWSKNQMSLLSSAPADQGLETRIQELNTDIIKLMKEETFCPELNKPCPVLNEQLQRRIQTRTAQLKDLNIQLTEYKQNYADYETKIKQLGPQPTVNTQQIQDIKADIYNLEVYEKQLTKLEGREERIKEYSEEINKLNTKIDEFNKQGDELTKILSNKSSIIQQETEINKQKLQNEDERQELSTKHSANMELLTIAKIAQERIDTNTEEIAKYKVNIKETNNKIESLLLVKDAFSANGIKAIVVDHVIPQLEDKINNILSQLSDFRIKLETQKSGLGKDVLLEGLFINIYNGLGEEFDYTNFSGGEKVKISMAINEALAGLTQIGFRILDEAIIALDNESIFNFLDTLNGILNQVNQVVCISHISEIKDMFDNKINIKKINGTSQI